MTTGTPLPRFDSFLRALRVGMLRTVPVLSVLPVLPVLLLPSPFPPTPLAHEERHHREREYRAPDRRRPGEHRQPSQAAVDTPGVGGGLVHGLAGGQKER